MTDPAVQAGADIFVAEITAVAASVSGYVPHAWKEKYLDPVSYKYQDNPLGRTGTTSYSPAVTLDGSGVSVGSFVFMRLRSKSALTVAGVNIFDLYDILGVAPGTGGTGAACCDPKAVLGENCCPPVQGGGGDCPAGEYLATGFDLQGKPVENCCQCGYGLVQGMGNQCINCQWLIDTGATVRCQTDGTVSTACGGVGGGGGGGGSGGGGGGIGGGGTCPPGYFPHPQFPNICCDQPWFQVVNLDGSTRWACNGTVVDTKSGGAGGAGGASSPMASSGGCPGCGGSSLKTSIPGYDINSCNCHAEGNGGGITTAPGTLGSQVLGVTGLGGADLLGSVTSALTDLTATVATISAPTTGSADTTDATLTTIQTYAVPDNASLLLAATTTARRTGGASGSAGDTFVDESRIAVKRTGGGNAVITGGGVISIYSVNDAAIGFGGVTFAVSSTNLLVKGTGHATTNYHWKSSITIINQNP